jgi:SAM-dependent methyltransferase
MELAYLVRFLPWDSSDPLAELVELVDSLAPGRALDLGCGTGTTVVYLAQHGWQVTGVDYVRRAIDTTRRRLRRYGYTATLVQGDITALSSLPIRGPFDLVTDFTCYQSIPLVRRDLYVREVAAVSRPGTTLLLYEFGASHGRMKVAGIPGATREDVQHRFVEHFDILEIRSGTQPRWVVAGGWGDWRPACYLLRKKGRGR